EGPESFAPMGARGASTQRQASGAIDVYDDVAGKLKGTAFAAEASGVQNSVEKVVKPALKNGEHARFYRSSTAHVYEFLLNTSDPPEQLRGSQTSGTYGHAFLKVKSPT